MLMAITPSSDFELIHLMFYLFLLVIVLLSVIIFLKNEH